MGLQVATPLELMMISLVNAERARAGLDALSVEMHLNEAAQLHSDWMGREGVLTHTGDGGSSARQRIEESGFELSGSWATRENVAFISLTGPLDEGEVRAMHNNLMNSPGHRANILSDNVDYIGIGLSRGKVVQNGQTYDVVFATQNFGKTSAEVLVQEELDGATVAVPYQDGEPVGEPIPVVEVPDTPAPNTPNEPDDEQEDPQDEGSASGGGCFVATAAYGHRMHPDVVDLRSFRDQVLVKHRLGRAFVRAYWKVGPVMARVVTPQGQSGRITRIALRPVVSTARRVLGKQ